MPRLLPVSALALLFSPAALAQQPQRHGEVSLHAGLVLTHLTPTGSTRSGGLGNGVTYKPGRTTPQLGSGLGLTLAIPVPPTGTRTFILVRGNLAYLRRALRVETVEFGPYAKPAAQLEEHYRTLTGRLMLGLRYYCDDFLVLELGPAVALHLSDQSTAQGHYLARPDSSFSVRPVGPAVGNVLLHGGLGFRHADGRRPWSVVAS